MGGREHLGAASEAPASSTAEVVVGAAPPEMTKAPGETTPGPCLRHATTTDSENTLVRQGVTIPRLVLLVEIRVEAIVEFGLRQRRPATSTP
jgi:hypothetical protein